MISRYHMHACLSLWQEETA